MLGIHHLQLGLELEITTSELQGTIGCLDNSKLHGAIQRAAGGSILCK